MISTQEDRKSLGRGIILFVNHKTSRCGVYEFGKNVFRCIKGSKRYKFVYVEVDSFQELMKEIVKYLPKAVIYNYMLTTMPWAYKETETEGVYFNRFFNIPCVQIGIIHAVEQFVADEATGRKKYVRTGDYNKLFDYYIAPDPTLLLKNPLVYKTGRPLIKYRNRFELPEVPSFGTIGLAKTNVSYISFIQKVQDEYDKAVIRINSPKGTFADNCFHKIKTELEGIIYKEGIKLELTRNYFTTRELLNFLAQNTANFFVYANGVRKKREARGISSSLDNALSVKRPVILSNDTMYKHVLSEVPYVDIEKNSIHEIVERGFAELEFLYNAWQPECMQWEYERIIEDIFIKIKKISLKTLIKVRWEGGGQAAGCNSWIAGLNMKEDDMTPVRNNFPICDNLREVPYNRVLDDFSRVEYQDIIEYMKQLLPNNMKPKMERANVQQAFVADTVLKLSRQFDKADILCVGCFTDTAYLILKKIGIPVIGIDTVVNYDLKTFLTRPDQKNQKYHIIFSTSVIEHVKDDEEFVRDIAEKLEDNGYFIMTCDFKDGYMPGDLKPDCDFRFYTAYDLSTRLISNMHGCKLVGGCDWKNKKNDFNDGMLEYSFASFVAQKSDRKR